MDLFGRLMFDLAIKRSAAVMEWSNTHRLCYPGVTVNFQNDNIQTIRGDCSCGEAFESTVVPHLVNRCLPKR